MLLMNVIVMLLSCTQRKEDTSEPRLSFSQPIVRPWDCQTAFLRRIRTGYGSVSGDFVNTTEANGTLRRWTGCDSYLFFNHHPDYDYPAQVWGPTLRTLSIPLAIRIISLILIKDGKRSRYWLYKSDSINFAGTG